MNPLLLEELLRFPELSTRVSETGLYMPDGRGGRRSAVRGNVRGTVNQNKLCVLLHLLFYFKHYIYDCMLGHWNSSDFSLI